MGTCLTLNMEQCTVCLCKQHAIMLCNCWVQQRTQACCIQYGAPSAQALVALMRAGDLYAFQRRARAICKRARLLSYQLRVPAQQLPACLST